MGRISCAIDGVKEKEFRSLVASKVGRRKGALGIALEQAIDEWMKRRQGGKQQ